MTSHPDIKLNIGLNVLRKRPDGFHDIETLFFPCNAFHDTLEIEPATGTKTEINIIGGGWKPETDLTFRAWELLKRDFDIPPVRIRLTKGSPVGAGLGGGSADAAFALKMMDSMFALGLSESRLAGYAACLGSDCAFFIYDRPMFGEGRGEILSPFSIDLSAYSIKVEVPAGVSVSTGEAYAGIRPGKTSGRPALKEALALPIEEWKDAVVNDFEEGIFRKHPEIAALKYEFYDNGAIYASMTGSGSAVFGIFGR